MTAHRVDLGLLGHSVTQKGAFPLALGVGTGLWVLEVLTCVYSGEEATSKSWQS